MIAMIFEVWPKSEHRQVISTQQQCCARRSMGSRDAEPGKILSLGFFRDEQALQDWRKASRSAGQRSRRFFYELSAANSRHHAGYFMNIKSAEQIGKTRLIATSLARALGKREAAARGADLSLRLGLHPVH
jgi:hypothetical protein